VEILEKVLKSHGLLSNGIRPEAAEEASKRRVLGLAFDAENEPPAASQPNFGKVDSQNEEHIGGNQFSGGVSTPFR
jgi:hypothetical protein